MNIPKPVFLNMGRWVVLPCVLLLAYQPFLAVGQISVELQIPSSKVRLYEPVIATVIFLNHSGRTVRFGANPKFARVRFEIGIGEGHVLPPLSKIPLLSGVELMPGAKRVLEFNISRLYAIRSVGLYRVRAMVDVDGVTYASAPKHLKVARGFELCRLMAGIPDDPTASRTYILEYMQKDTLEENLYLCIEDETTRNMYGVFNLGRVVRVRMPNLQADESGNVHVLFQTPGMDYVHAAFTPYGVALMSENISGWNRQVKLARQPNGRIALTSDGKFIKGNDTTSTTLPAVEEGPVTEFKKTAGGLLGKFVD